MRTPARPLRDSKTVLQEWAQARGLPTPAYREVERTGPHHDPEFRVAVELPDLEPAEGIGRSKRAAEQAAAAAMLTRAGVRRTASMADETTTRCGFIALIGAPNVGKSTLINALVGSKVAIVSHKVQTTRTLVRGIAIEGASQLVFIDTPGIFAPRRRLDRAMVTNAWAGAHDADIVGRADRCERGLDEEARRSSTSLPTWGSRRSS